MSVFLFLFFFLTLNRAFISSDLVSERDFNHIKRRLPCRRTHTGLVVGGCFPEEEQLPAHTHTHTQTDEYFHIVSLIYPGWEPAEMIWPASCSSLVITGYTNTTTDRGAELFSFALYYKKIKKKLRGRRRHGGKRALYTKDGSAGGESILSLCSTSAGPSVNY